MPGRGDAPLIPPMLASVGRLPAGSGWAYEFKWDGVRAVAYVDHDQVTGEEDAFVRSHRLADLPGIGPAFAAQLARRGLVHVEDAIRIERGWLRSSAVNQLLRMRVRRPTASRRFASILAASSVPPNRSR